MAAAASSAKSEEGTAKSADGTAKSEVKAAKGSLAVYSDISDAELATAIVQNYLKEYPQSFAKNKIIGITIESEKDDVKVQAYTPTEKFDTKSWGINMEALKQPRFHGVAVAQYYRENGTILSRLFYFRKNGRGKIEEFTP
jgi:hypothetical protein